MSSQDVAATVERAERSLDPRYTGTPLTAAEQDMVRRAAAGFTAALRELQIMLDRDELHIGRALGIAHDALHDSFSDAEPMNGEHVSFRMCVWIAADGLRLLRAITATVILDEQAQQHAVRRAVSARFARITPR